MSGYADLLNSVKDINTPVGFKNTTVSVNLICSESVSKASTRLINSAAYAKINIGEKACHKINTK